MLSDKVMFMQRERYKDLQREIAKNELIRQAQAGTHRTPWLVRAIATLIATLGNVLMAARCRVIERFGRVSGEPVSTPCQSPEAGAVPSPL